MQIPGAPSEVRIGAQESAFYQALSLKRTVWWSQAPLPEPPAYPSTEGLGLGLVRQV